ncbi:hypothetical protein BCR33DRAFT_816706 [Rhizoclosmatium globosum]|uniref:Uncharacterized protein n=1 Tax=Rhizoclosmatium globosum TaxID=329046 RepID=A0A1Y2CCX6_9FUNG|nr:hypothetical protein BCR33DRAFT_816706 [Rhizoclosmatium globosum]|eukprot:ORY44899.1 hypothetical protein BCR33DRAFT_816706 [Rhizoclosmatium globosum]
MGKCSSPPNFTRVDLMNSTSPTLLSSLEGNAKYVLDLASYVSITVSILGMALSLVLICSISRAKWRAKRCPTPASHASYIDNTLLAVLYVITLYSVLVLVQNIVWIVDLLSLDQTWVLALLTYALMFALFVCNVRLAFERQSMVQSAHIPDVSSRSLFSLRKGSLGVNLLIYGAPIAFFILQIASFIICVSPLIWFQLCSRG